MYQGQNFQAIGLEHWNGSAENVRTFFQQPVGLTYPVCLNAKSTHTAYQVIGNHYSVVIDQSGVIRYRGTSVQVSQIKNMIDNLLLTRIGDDQVVIDEFRLKQNYPNPFNPSTTIRFSLDESQQISLIIYDVRGRFIRQLLNVDLNSGTHEMNWDGRSQSGNAVASGIYYYQLIGTKQSKFRKMTLIR